VQRRHVRDGVVGRHQPQHRVRVGLAQQERGRGDGRRAVARDRLEEDARVRDPRLAQLLGHQESVRLVADDDRRREARPDRARRGLLEHGARVADQRPELLRIPLPRQRPEPAAGAAGQDHGYNRHAHSPR
jgi:hypothetical protein